MITLPETIEVDCLTTVPVEVGWDQTLRLFAAEFQHI